jgi:hypothetical protein
MLARNLALMMPITDQLNAEGNYHLTLTPDEWITTRKIINMLKPFKQVYTYNAITFKLQMDKIKLFKLFTQSSYATCVYLFSLQDYQLCLELVWVPQHLFAASSA